MNCRDARGALLEAELADLQPRAEGALAAHLATCTACRNAADRVLAGTERLATARAGAPVRASATMAAAARAAGLRQRTRRRRLRVVVPLLAAASLAVLLVRNPWLDRLAGPPTIGAPPMLPPIVEAGGENVAVFTTNRPDVTVVWQF